MVHVSGKDECDVCLYNNQMPSPEGRTVMEVLCKTKENSCINSRERL